jgi:hypothetical protein
MIAFCALRKWAFLQLQAEAIQRYLRQGRLKGRLLCLEFRFQLINEIQRLFGAQTIWLDPIQDLFKL